MALLALVSESLAVHGVLYVFSDPAKLFNSGAS